MTRRLTNHLSVNCWPMQSLSSVTLTLYICYTEIGSLLFQHAALFKVAIIFPRRDMKNLHVFSGLSGVFYI